MSSGVGKRQSIALSWAERRLGASSRASTAGKGENEGGAGTAGLGQAELLRLPGQMQH